MKVTTWAMVALVIAAGAVTAIRPAQGCSDVSRAAAHSQPRPKAAPAAPSGHRSFIIAARMGWL